MKAISDFLNNTEGDKLLCFGVFFLIALFFVCVTIDSVFDSLKNKRK